VAKRFTDTGKWKDEWFKTLSPHAKLVWVYICDDCDHAGIWVSDFEVMSLRLGIKVDEAKFKEMLGNKVRKFERTRYFIPSFFNFQYASSKEGFRAKQSALSSLQKYGLVDTQGTLKEEFMDTQPTLSEQSLDCLSISKSKGKSSSNTGSAEGAAYSVEFEAAWKLYPRKDDKSLAYKAYLANVLPDERPSVPEAIEKYRTKLKSDGTAAKYIKLGATFFNGGKWRDCLDPSYGKSEDFSADAPAGGDYRPLAEVFAERERKGEAS